MEATSTTTKAIANRTIARRNATSVSVLFCSLLGREFMVVSAEIIRNLDDLVRIDFQGARDSYFLWLLISSGAVAAGVILEGPEVIHESARVLRNLLDHNERRTPRWIVLVGLLGWILVAVGVAGEGIAEAVVSKTDSQLEFLNRTLLTEEQNRVALANERAESAITQAGDVASQATALRALLKEEQQIIEKFREQSTKTEARLSEATAALTNATARLESTQERLELANRRHGLRETLLIEAKVARDARLAPFAGQHVKVSDCERHSDRAASQDPTGVERRETLAELMAELLGAQWLPVEDQQSCVADPRGRGIDVLIESTAVNSTRQAAEALASVLHDALLDPREKSTVQRVPGVVLGDRYTIVVYVDDNRP